MGLKDRLSIGRETRKGTMKKIIAFNPDGTPFNDRPFQFEPGEPGKPILCFGAHPDDIVLGCGGLIASLRGVCQVTAVTVTEGKGGTRGRGRSAQATPTGSPPNRLEEDREALGLLGVDVDNGHYRPLGATMAQLIGSDALFRKVVGLIREIRPRMVLTHSQDDYHRKHVAISRLVEEACWQAGQLTYQKEGEPHRVEAIYQYEVFNLFSRPSLVVDVTSSFKLKLDALRRFESQLDIFPGLVEYADSLGTARGFLLGKDPYCYGTDAPVRFKAEAFRRPPGYLVTDDGSVEPFP